MNSIYQSRINKLLATPIYSQDNLRRAFDTPAFNARPWMYWYWMNGSVTKEGIIADMKGFHEAGIGGVNQMDIGIWPQGAVTYHSKEWYELIRKEECGCAREHRARLKILENDSWRSEKLLVDF